MIKYYDPSCRFSQRRIAHEWLGEILEGRAFERTLAPSRLVLIDAAFCILQLADLDKTNKRWDRVLKWRQAGCPWDEACRIIRDGVIGNPVVVQGDRLRELMHLV